MRSKRNKKVDALLCITMLLMLVVLDMRFYINYLSHQNEYKICKATIEEIAYQSYGKTGVYEDAVLYMIEGRRYVAHIRSALGDYIGKEIAVAVQKNDYTKAVRSDFYIEKKPILHTCFVCIIISYLIFLGVEYYRERRWRRNQLY